MANFLLHLGKAFFETSLFFNSVYLGVSIANKGLDSALDNNGIFLIILAVSSFIGMAILEYFIAKEAERS